MSSQRFGGVNVLALRPGLDSSKAGADDDRDPPTGGGMEPPMSDYVTHAEFGAAMSKIDLRFDQTATKTDIAELRGDIHKSAVDIQRWMIATVIGLFVGFGGLFLAMSNALKPSPAPSAQAPIIITMPSAIQAPAVPPVVPQGK